MTATDTKPASAHPQGAKAAPPEPSTAMTVRQDEPELTPFQVIERVISSGDLSAMAPDARVAFYWRTCESLGLNPLTRPFDFIAGDGGKIVMYAKRDATDQLRKIHHVSVDELDRKFDDNAVTVEARGSILDPEAPGGIRRDSALGSVFIKGLGGQSLSNAFMKAETKAKRRLTLSLVGLGFLDESEIEGVGVPAGFDPETGELVETAAPQTLLERVQAQREALEGTAETPTPATAPEGVAEGPATEEPAVADVTEGWTREEFIARLREADISPRYAGEVAKRVWPDREASLELTPAQRVELFDVLVAEGGSDEEGKGL